MTSSLALRMMPPRPDRRDPDQRVLDVLLGDRRPALGVAAEDVVLGGTREAGEREPGIGVEVAVLCGHHRVAHVHGYLVDVDVDAIAFGWNDFGDLTAVAGQDRRHLVGSDVARFGHFDDHVGHAERHERQQNERGDRDVDPAPDPLPVDLVHRRQAARRPAAWSATAGRRTPRRHGRRRLRRRGAVQRRLDGLDRVAQRSGVVSHRRDDRGMPIVEVADRPDGEGAGVRPPQSCGRPHRQQPVPQGHRWLTGYGALRYSLAVRAPLRAVRVGREPFGGRTAPSTYDFTR